MQVVLRHLVASIAMVGGAVGVLGLVYGMNGLDHGGQQEGPPKSSEMVVEKEPPKKSHERPKPQPKPQRAPTPTHHAPAPNITTAMSGVSFGLPQFQTERMVGADELLGAAPAAAETMTPETVDTPPRRASCPNPQYPAKAQQRGIQGYVMLKLKLSARGDVESVKVVDADPKGVFEDAALTAIRGCTFTPATYKGQAVAMADVMQKVPFKLN